MNLLREMSLRLIRSGYEAGEARAVALLVLEEGFGVCRTDIYADKVRDFSADDTLRLENIMLRLAEGEPVQYCLGVAEFDDMRLEVNKSTLIPRPETQQLVNIVAEDAPSYILDIGTGSGCIAIALKRRLPEAHVEAWDISSDAIAVARRNAKRYEAEVVFRRVDILARRRISRYVPFAIVSNPPYIVESEGADMERQILEYEPVQALFVPDENPLMFYRKIGELAANARADVYFETNRLYAYDVANLMRMLGYRNVIMQKDVFGNDRFVVAKQPLIYSSSLTKIT